MCQCAASPSCPHIACLACLACLAWSSGSCWRRSCTCADSLQSTRGKFPAIRAASCSVAGAQLPVSSMLARHSEPGATLQQDLTAAARRSRHAEVAVISLMHALQWSFLCATLMAETETKVHTHGLLAIVIIIPLQSYSTHTALSGLDPGASPTKTSRTPGRSSSSCRARWGTREEPLETHRNISKSQSTSRSKANPLHRVAEKRTRTSTHSGSVSPHRVTPRKAAGRKQGFKDFVRQASRKALLHRPCPGSTRRWPVLEGNK